MDMRPAGSRRSALSAVCRRSTRKARIVSGAAMRMRSAKRRRIAQMRPQNRNLVRAGRKHVNDRAVDLDQQRMWRGEPPRR